MQSKDIFLSDGLTISFSLFQYRVGANGNCTNQATSCTACYFAREERPLPDKCTTDLRNYSCAGLTGSDLKECLQTWGECVKKAFKDVHGKVFGKYRTFLLFVHIM